MPRYFFQTLNGEASSDPDEEGKELADLELQRWKRAGQLRKLSRKRSTTGALMSRYRCRSWTSNASVFHRFARKLTSLGCEMRRYRVVIEKLPRREHVAGQLPIQVLARIWSAVATTAADRCFDEVDLMIPPGVCNRSTHQLFQREAI